MRGLLKALVTVGVVVFLGCLFLVVVGRNGSEARQEAVAHSESATPTPVEATESVPTYHESDDVLDLYEVSKNPYKFKGRSGVVDTARVPMLMSNGARVAYVPFPGGNLKFNKMLDEHTAIYEVMVAQEEVMPDGEIVVNLPDSDPPQSGKPWRVLVEGPFDGLNGLGRPITLTALRFEGYYVPKRKPESTLPSEETRLTGSTTEVPDERIKWTASSRTADSITGDIELSSNHLIIANAAFPLRVVRKLNIDEVREAAKVFSLNLTPSSHGWLYRTGIPATAVMKGGNTLCGSMNVEWLLSLESHGDSHIAAADEGLSLAFFSGTTEPTLDEHAISQGNALCGTFSYSRVNSSASPPN